MVVNSKMRKVKIFLILMLYEASCYDNIKFGDLPEETQTEIHDIQTAFTISLFPDCQVLQQVQLEFFLYNRDNSHNPIRLNSTNPRQIDSNKKVIVVVHGWIQTFNSSGIVQLKNAYLERYDANVILVDWSQLSMQTYTTSYCHMQRMSIQLGKFLCQFSTQLDIQLSDVHLIGYSIGAHLAGVSAQIAKSKCKRTIGRITGLDPAGPVYAKLPTRRRLDKTDATFVHIIHTDQMKYGHSSRIGHNDFYPNCGIKQPGCPTIKDPKANTSLSDIMCSHHRSLDYMIESVASDNFVAVSCIMCPRACRPSILHEIYTVMGEGASLQRDTGFYLTTRNDPPYGEGWTLAGAKLP